MEETEKKVKANPFEHPVFVYFLAFLAATLYNFLVYLIFYGVHDSLIYLRDGAVTGGTLAGTADGKTHYTSYNGTYYCYPSYTKFLNTSIWSSSEHSAQDSWNWGYTPQYWDNSYKYTSNSVFFARAF